MTSGRPSRTGLGLLLENARVDVGCSGCSPSWWGAGSGGHALTRGQLLLLAITGGVSVANLYYLQPLLALVGRELGAAVLLARTVSGVLGAHLGWRTVYFLAGAIMVGLAATLRLRLPRSRPERTLAYPALLRSLWPIARQEPVRTSGPAAVYALTRRPAGPILTSPWNLSCSAPQRPRW